MAWKDVLGLNFCSDDLANIKVAFSLTGRGKEKTRHLHRGLDTADVGWMIRGLEIQGWLIQGLEIQGWLIQGLEIQGWLIRGLENIDRTIIQDS